MRLIRSITLASAAVALLAACSSKGDTSGGSSDVATDIGVTSSTIKLGVLTDLSGPFAGLATPWLRGQELFFDQLNKDGGVCSRDVELVVKDHGYNVQNAAQLYAQVAPEVVGFSHLVGSPMIAAVLPTVSQDQILSAVGSWASPLLENENVLMAGTPSDIEMINAVQYLVDEGVLQKGDTLGSIYIEGEYGANGLAGAAYAAKELGLKHVKATLKATDTDATSVIAQFSRQDVDAITLTTSSAQTASAVSVAAQSMPDVKFVANGAAFVPGILKTNAGPALEKSLLVAGSALPFTADTPEVQKVRDAFGKKFPSATGEAGVTYGYGVAKIYGSVLDKACENGDLTRAGLNSAFRELTEVDTGVIAPLDFSTKGGPPARAAYVASVDTETEGGLTVVKDLSASPLAEKYTIGE